MLELAETCGLHADPWQRDIIVSSTGLRADGNWSAFEVGVEVSRQNGKGSLLEIRALGGLYIVGERLITWSAHLYDTAMEAMRRVLELTEEADLQREIKHISRTNGKESIELRSGQRLRFRTRTKSAGRGLTGDLLIFDEAMDLPETSLAAVFPIVSARPNPQIWYTGSAVDQETMDHGVVFARVRERGRAGEQRLAWFEFSAPFDHPDQVTPEAAGDPEVWAAANPALGRRISEEYVAAERRALSARSFAVERLGVGDWPATSEDHDQVIADVDWDALADPESRRSGPVVFVFDVTPDRRKAAIAVAGHRSDGLRHVEIVDHRNGTDWLLDRLAELDERHEPDGILCAARSPAASMVARLADRDVEVTEIDETEHAKACGDLVDAVTERSFRHLGTPELRAAIKGASRRVREDGTWTWSRKASTADISPLVASTLALRRADLMQESMTPMLAWR